MLWTIVAILLIIYIVGLLTGNSFSGAIHLLLLIILILVVLELLGIFPARFSGFR
jgi:hypothetical protein